jgi:nucleotide-binding universal stress UspA family protein
MRRDKAMSGEQTPGRIVVGVDGSPSSRAALAWAVHQAGLTGASVEAVIAWHYPVMFGGVPFGPIGPLENADFGEWAASVLTHTIKEAVEPDGPVKVSATVREGSAAQVLLDAADGADLLVVGSRGHGGFAEALLGSVSQACVHHAQCPVVIMQRPKAG